MGKYRLSLRSYCKIHSMEIAIDRAESEGRLEALFDQVYGEHTARVVEELFGEQAKKSLMKNDAVDFSEAYSLLKTLKEDGIIELDHGEEMRIGKIPDQCTADRPQNCGTDHSRPDSAGEGQNHPNDGAH